MTKDDFGELVAGLIIFGFPAWLIYSNCGGLWGLVDFGVTAFGLFLILGIGALCAK